MLQICYTLHWLINEIFNCILFIQYGLNYYDISNALGSATLGWAPTEWRMHQADGKGDPMHSGSAAR